MRSFDPRAVGRLECRAWETYYRRRWGAFLLASVGMVRAAFGMSWPRTRRAAPGSSCAPTRSGRRSPTTTPTAARRLMADFYRLLVASEALAIDPVRAAELEVEWWRAHREAQDKRAPEPAEELIDGPARPLRLLLRGRRPRTCVRAARLRAEAMDVSDRWVTAGCDPEHPLLAEERALLVRSYSALLAAVHR